MHYTSVPNIKKLIEPLFLDDQNQEFKANFDKPKNLQKLIEQLSARTSSTQRKPTIVMDAGIATKDNLELLKENQFEYMCVARSSLNKYTIDADCHPV